MNVGRKAHRILGLNGLNFWGKKNAWEKWCSKKKLFKKKKTGLVYISK